MSLYAFGLRERLRGALKRPSDTHRRGWSLDYGTPMNDSMIKNRRIG